MRKKNKPPQLITSGKHKGKYKTQTGRIVTEGMKRALYTYTKGK